MGGSERGSEDVCNITSADGVMVADLPLEIYVKIYQSKMGLMVAPECISASAFSKSSAFLMSVLPCLKTN